MIHDRHDGSGAPRCDAISRTSLQVLRQAPAHAPEMPPEHSIPNICAHVSGDVLYLRHPNTLKQATRAPPAFCRQKTATLANCPSTSTSTSTVAIARGHRHALPHTYSIVIQPSSAAWAVLPGRDRPRCRRPVFMGSLANQVPKLQGISRTRPYRYRHRRHSLRPFWLQPQSVPSQPRSMLVMPTHAREATGSPKLAARMATPDRAVGPQPH